MKTPLVICRVKCLILSDQEPAYYSLLMKDLESEGIYREIHEDDTPFFCLLFLDEVSLCDQAISQLKKCKDQNLKTLVIYDCKRPLPHFKTLSFLHEGASDVFCQMPFEEISSLIKARLKRWAMIKHIIIRDRIGERIIGDSSIWKETLSKVIELACFSKASVLIEGESGTGKELIAHLIHDLDRRPDKGDLIVLDCTTVVSDLSGSEFFGHEKGAFTNALSMREGVFSLANRGTLFLDEIGELPLPLQAELLRVIQEGSYKRVGSNQWRKTNFRLVCATNRNLEEEVAKGNFRHDLYFRIKSAKVELPPLRNRREDIISLLEHFLKESLPGEKIPPLDKYVLNFLNIHGFPGNIRELKHIAYKIGASYTGEGRITLGTFFDQTYTKNEEPIPIKEISIKESIQEAVRNGIGLKEIKRMAANMAMEIAVEDNEGNLQMAARQLQVSDRTLQHFQATKNQELE